MFVGTKRQAQDAITEEATRCSMFYVNNRWLGGLLTNWVTVQKSVKRLKELDEMATDGRYELLPKKEVIVLERARKHLQANLAGIKNMSRVPMRSLSSIRTKSRSPCAKLASWAFRWSLWSIPTAIPAKWTTLYPVTMMRCEPFACSHRRFRNRLSKASSCALRPVG